MCRKGFKKGVEKFEDLQRSLKNNFEFSRRNVRGLDSSMVSTQEHRVKEMMEIRDWVKKKAKWLERE
ncbi:unnamed protein product [Camellia sinensis]